MLQICLAAHFLVVCCHPMHERVNFLLLIQQFILLFNFWASTQYESSHLRHYLFYVIASRVVVLIFHSFRLNLDTTRSCQLAIVFNSSTFMSLSPSDQYKGFRVCAKARQRSLGNLLAFYTLCLCSRPLQSATFTSIESKNSRSWKKNVCHRNDKVIPDKSWGAYNTFFYEICTWYLQRHYLLTLSFCCVRENERQSEDLRWVASSGDSFPLFWLDVIWYCRTHVHIVYRLLNTATLTFHLTADEWRMILHNWGWWNGSLVLASIEHIEWMVPCLRLLLRWRFECETRWF